MTEDEIRTHVLEVLHSSPDGYRALVRDMAAAHPGIDARLLERALGTAAAEMDAAIRRAGSSTDEARTARRLALLLAMDIDRLEGDGPATLGALMKHWTAQDDFFLRL